MTCKQYQIKNTLHVWLVEGPDSKQPSTLRLGRMRLCCTYSQWSSTCWRYGSPWRLLPSSLYSVSFACSR